MATTMEETNTDAQNSPVETGMTKHQTVAKGNELAEDANWFEASQDPVQECLAILLPDRSLKSPTKKVLIRLEVMKMRKY